MRPLLFNPAEQREILAALIVECTRKRVELDRRHQRMSRAPCVDLDAIANLRREFELLDDVEDWLDGVATALGEAG